MKKAICLVSGGMDSCVAAAVAVSTPFEPAFLHVTYGQLTAEREKRAFAEIAEHYKVRDRLIVEASYLCRIGASALTDRSIELEDGKLGRREIPRSYVPFRNANLLAIATSWAEATEVEQIFIGAVEEDSSGYPDCRKEFFSAFEGVIEEGTRPETKVEIHTPLIDLSKAEIVRRGIELEAPLQLTWSCYRSSDRPCLRCDSCLLRKKGFSEAGFDDPILAGTRGLG